MSSHWRVKIGEALAQIATEQMALGLKTLDPSAVYNLWNHLWDSPTGQDLQKNLDELAGYRKRHLK